MVRPADDRDKSASLGHNARFTSRNPRFPECGLPGKRVYDVNARRGTLLVPVHGLSGTVYPAGTQVSVSGRGSSVDAFVDGDWLPLAWWEFAEGIDDHAE